MNKLSHSSVFFALTFLFVNTAIADTRMSCYQHGKTHYDVMPGYYSGDFNVVNSSCPTFGNRNWINFGMEWKYWKDWGFNDACNVNTPLNRTLRALELLRISKNPRISNRNLLNSAYDFSKKWIHHLRVDCAFNNMDEASGRHVPKPKWQEKLRKGKNPGSGTIYLYQNIFGHPIVTITNTIIHEARHKQKFHNGGYGCPRKASCDTHFKYMGANSYELLYSWIHGMHSGHSNQFIRQRALDEARVIQDIAFNNRPNFNIRKVAN
jgi:hypothetical protein